MATATTTGTIDSNFLTYRNSDQGITIQYPAYWDKDEILGVGEFIVSFSPSTNTNVHLDVSVYKPNDIPSFPYNNTTLNELVYRQINDLREHSGFRLMISKPTTLANNFAYEIVYYDGVRKSVTMEIWTLKNDKAYEIEYTAVDSIDENLNEHTVTSQFSSYLPSAKIMIDSFKFDTLEGVTVPPTRTVPPTAITKEPSGRPSSPQPQPEQRPNETQQEQPQSPADSSGDYYGQIFSLVSWMIIVAAIAVVIAKIRGRGRGKHRERRGFPDYIKEEVLRKQNHRCAHCNKILNVVDWDHIDGNRSNNKESNCQALCPNCHAVKTRRGDR